MSRFESSSRKRAFEEQSNLEHPSRRGPSGKKTARAEPSSLSGGPKPDIHLVETRGMPSDIIATIESKRGAWSAPELAELLGCSGKHIYALAKSGRLPHLRIGGMIRFDPCVTAAWLRERSIAA